MLLPIHLHVKHNYLKIADYARITNSEEKIHVAIRVVHFVESTEIKYATEKIVKYFIFNKEFTTVLRFNDIRLGRSRCFKTYFPIGSDTVTKRSVKRVKVKLKKKKTRKIVIFYRPCDFVRFRHIFLE